MSIHFHLHQSLQYCIFKIMQQLLQYIYSSFQMFSKVENYRQMIQKAIQKAMLYFNKFKTRPENEKYRQMIQTATQKILLLPEGNNQDKKSIITLQCNIKLPSAYSYKSSQQIQKNIPIFKQITHSTSKQSKLLQNEWPSSCIGLILCEHKQNNRTFYVYGTGALIQKNIVLTSAQNLYCRRLNIQYINIRFITGVSDNKCSGIYDVKRVYYPKVHTKQGDKNYNFALVQLQDDLSKSYGYVGSNTADNIQQNEKLTEYGFISDNQEGFFKMRQISKLQKSKDWECCSGSGLLVKIEENRFCIVGLRKTSSKNEFIILDKKIRNKINQQSQLQLINLDSKNIGTQGCRYLSQTNLKYLDTIYLVDNNIDPQGCKYLSRAKWINLTTINLCRNNIGAQGSKYLSETNWIHLTAIYLSYNNIDAQGCKYLSQTNWIHLNTIYLSHNKIDAQGCQHLAKTKWKHLTYIDLMVNIIDAQACKYLSQTNWIHLNTIYLNSNNIGAQGCRYLSQSNWNYLSSINLFGNNIGVQGCKYLSQSNWIYLAYIYLNCNEIGIQGCKYLIQTNWIQLIQISLAQSNIKDVIQRLLLQQLWPNSEINYDWC